MLLNSLQMILFCTHKKHFCNSLIFLHLLQEAKCIQVILFCTHKKHFCNSYIFAFFARDQMHTSDTWIAMLLVSQIRIYIYIYIDQFIVVGIWKNKFCDFACRHQSVERTFRGRIKAKKCSIFTINTEVFYIGQL